MEWCYRKSTRPWVETSQTGSIRMVMDPSPRWHFHIGLSKLKSKSKIHLDAVHSLNSTGFDLHDPAQMSINFHLQACNAQRLNLISPTSHSVQISFFGEWFHDAWRDRFRLVWTTVKPTASWASDWINPSTRWLGLIFEIKDVHSFFRYDGGDDPWWLFNYSCKPCWFSNSNFHA